MGLLVPHSGEVLALAVLLNQSAPQDVTLHLYRNDVTPTDSTTLADLTECTYPGYAALVLSGANWAISTTGGTTTATYAEQAFPCTADTAAQSVYGYYLTQGATVVWVERFTDGPLSIQRFGDTVRLSPRLICS